MYAIIRKNIEQFIVFIISIDSRGALKVFCFIFFDLLLIVPDGIAVQTTSYGDFVVITHVILIFNTDGTADQCRVHKIENVFVFHYYGMIVL
jgi:hypothetical protein